MILVRGATGQNNKNLLKLKLMNTKELEFSVFCIENIAEHLGINGDEAYRLLAEKSDILDNYIIPYYDTLHTQGKDYIVNELMEVMSERGLTV